MSECILIIGATSDMAQAFAKRVSLEGKSLMLAARDEKILKNIANDIRVRSGVEVTTHLFDILDMNSHKNFYEGLPKRPDGVICFVGLLGDSTDCHRSFELAKKVIDTNFTGVVSLLDLVANEFEERKSGWLVGLSSVAGDRGRSPRYHYGSAKAGLNAYLSGLRQRLYKANVLVLNVIPGYCRTKMVEGWKLPAGFTSDPDEVAIAILKAITKKRDVIYVRSVWRWIMFILKSIPEAVFKRLKI